MTMRKLSLIFIVIIGWLFTMNAQVAINITGATPDASSGLDVSFTNKGLLIPRVALTATNAAGPITSPTTSLLVYNTATASSGATAVTPGYYYWTGTEWSRVLDAASGKPWLLTGNAGTVAGTNFIGTTDAIDFVVKTNNTEKLRVQSGGNVGIGTTAPIHKVDVVGGNIRASGEIISTMTTGSGQFRAISGNYGAIFRNDGNDTYLPLITASGDQYGSWNTLRPLRINNATGDVYLANANSIFRHSDGFVGIGTTAPAEKLHVNGSFRLTNGTQAAGRILTSDANGTGTWQTPPVQPVVYSETTSPYGSTTTRKTITITTNNATDKVLLLGEFDYSKDGSSSYTSLAIWRGGTEIAETSIYSTADADNTVFVQWVDTPGLGTFTYTLQDRSGAGGYSTIYGSMLTAVVYK